MTSFAVEFRHDNPLLGFIKPPNHFLHQSWRKIRMIDKMHEHAIAIVIELQVPDCELQRRELSQFVIGVDQNFDRQMRNLWLKFAGIVSENHDNFTNPRLLQSSNNPLNESLTIDGQERFGPSHAARFAGGENHGDNHDWPSTLRMVKISPFPSLRSRSGHAFSKRRRFLMAKN